MVTATEPRSRDNLPPPLVPFNLFDRDPSLSAMVDGLPQPILNGLSEDGRVWGAAEMFELGRLANLHPPQLRTHDAYGRRIDRLEVHPAHNALMRRAVASGIAASAWNAAGPEAAVRSVARAARIYMASMVDAGHLALPSATSASVAALGHAAPVAEAWVPGMLSGRYDPADRAAADKSGLTVGFALSERAAGSDREGCTAEARQSKDGDWLISGHKWFVLPGADGQIALAHSIGGLSAFLVPRFTPDGAANAVAIERLKPTIGLRSAAVGEVTFRDAFAWPLGEAGKGVAVIADSIALMRLDEITAAVGQMRHAMALAIHHARHRRVNTLPLSDHPLMTRVLADMELDVIAATGLAFRLAEAHDRADGDPAEAAFVRLMTPVVAYWITRVAPAVAAECMDSLGGSGYAADGELARIFAALPAAGLRCGGGNVLCMDVVRLLRRSSDTLETVLAGIQDSLGRSAQSSLNILRAAAAVALAEEGSARVFVEQLAMTAAAAVLRRRLPSVVSDAFVETRLTKPWRSSYGMLDSRFDARAFLNYLHPR